MDSCCHLHCLPKLHCAEFTLPCRAAQLACRRRTGGSGGGHSLHDGEDRQQIIEVGHYGLQQEVEQLKRDKNVLMQEVIRLRQQQQVGAGGAQGLGQGQGARQQGQQGLRGATAEFNAADSSWRRS